MHKVVIIGLIYLLTLSSPMAKSSDQDIDASVKEYDLANIAMMKEQDQDAYTHLKAAVKLDPGNSTYLNGAGYLAMKLGEFENSLDFLHKALEIDIKDFGDNHPNVASILNNIGSVYSKMGDHDKALDYYNKAYTIMEDSLGENHPQTQTVKKIRDEEKKKIL
ncbi:MAG: tetratricopeptide repeat protein [Alphaproteobacteria bacterium]|nr:tetratricopeptide repeat protein [Alphaproteobacteria bacterium]HPF47033.1 tetratricopeptide repeat protein [Emcibacteraceae bacterium]HRW29154.1 tetratricopeptide repeat protein [Emcibacteraceae bacterium]